MEIIFLETSDFAFVLFLSKVVNQFEYLLIHFSRAENGA